MIRSISGTVEEVNDLSVVISVSGIGYLVGCPCLTNQISLGMQITLHTYLAVRENALDLYGFPQKRDLEMFELLITIPKIGPKSALQILAQATSALIVEAIQKKDAIYLHKLSGLGKKTCENIVQYLADKLDRLSLASTVPSIDTTTQTQVDAIEVLISLGYDINTAREAIGTIETQDDATINMLVTRALKQIK